MEAEHAPEQWAKVAEILAAHRQGHETTVDCLNAINAALAWSDLLEACELLMSVLLLGDEIANYEMAKANAVRVGRAAIAKATKEQT